MLLGLPIAQADGAGEVGLQRAAREDTVAHGGAGLEASKFVARRVKGRPSALKLVAEHIARDARRAEFAARGGVDGDASAGGEFHRQISRERTKVREIVRDGADLNALAERAGEIDPRVRQRQIRLSRA